ncbi:alpha/beta hydrolase [Streptomyces europaeiscabiei]
MDKKAPEAGSEGAIGQSCVRHERRELRAVSASRPPRESRLTHETIKTNAGTDKILSKGLLEFFRDAWIGGTGIEFTDARINLNRADLSGLPPTLVSWGGYEVLAGEDQEFAARVKDAGIDTATVVAPGGQHSYLYGAGRIPETDAAIAQIGAWVREKTKI